jgi:hypothetical protein
VPAATNNEESRLNVQTMAAEPAAHSQHPGFDATYAAALHMARHGGHFASALAAAYFKGDDANRARIVEAFPEYFAKHSVAA